jgi:hypothetical protein
LIVKPSEWDIVSQNLSSKKLGTGNKLISEATNSRIDVALQPYVSIKATETCSKAYLIALTVYRW